MPLSVAPLLPTLQRLQHATTPEHEQNAVAAFYAVAHPILTERWLQQLPRSAPARRQAAEDRASDTLLAIVNKPRRARRCRATTADGVLTWLCTLPSRPLAEQREARARRDAGVRIVALTDDAAVLLPPVDDPHGTDSTADFRRAHRQALKGLRPLDQRVWRERIEQNTPLAELARTLGQDESTVRRRLQRIAAVLRLKLAAFAPHTSAVAGSRRVASVQERHAR